MKLLLVITLAVIPSLIAIGPTFLISNTALKLTWALFIPVIYGSCLPLLAGLLSRFFQKHIETGTYPRTNDNKTHQGRTLYDICWTAVVFTSPIYWLILNVRPLRNTVLRLFGYQGQMNFTLYPDTFIRDLPLLKFGNGAYISPRATLGTHIALQNEEILIDSIYIEDQAVIGQQAMVGPGSRISTNSHIGPGCITGLRCIIGKDTQVHEGTSVHHGVIVEDRCNIGGHSILGVRCTIRADITLPDGSHIPPNTEITHQVEADKLLAKERSQLMQIRHKVAELLAIG